jgi:hypothetical protein
MGYNGPEIITRFIEYAGKPDGTENDGKNGRSRQRFPDGKGSSLYYAYDGQRRCIEIQSYGSHFPLARLMLTPSGKRKMWLLNGDRWPGSGGFGRTNEHNDIARAAAQASGTPCFIVPFSAIQSAGILPDTIKPIEIQPESWITEDHSAATLAEVPDYKRKRSVWHINGQLTEAPVNEKGVKANPDYRGNWTFYERKLTDKGLSWVTEIVPGPAYTPDELTQEYEDIESAADGLYHWTTERHWLGASVFRAKYRFGGQVGTGAKRRWVSGTRTATFVTAFDYEEPAPLWFMSELPRGVRPKTVAEAIDALKPWRVRSAEERGTPVIRQGDVFVIQATGITEKDLIEQGGEMVEFESIAGGWGRPGKHGRYINDSHTATRVIKMPGGALYAQGIMRHRPLDRRPDHVQRPLWDRNTWGRVELNTQARSFDNTPRSWSRGGDVD